MEPKTLYVCNLALSLFLGMALLFFRTWLKTYAGFGLWVASMFLVAAGHVSVLLRLAGPLYLSIVLNNLFFTLTVLFRLGGMLKFLRDRELPKAVYVLVPLLELAAVSYFHLVFDWYAMRVLILSSVLTVVVVAMAYLLFHRASKADKTLLYRGMGWMCLAFGVIFILRSSVLFFDRSIGMFTHEALHSFYLLAIVVIESAWAMGFLMMNSKRMEDDLLQSQDELSHTITKLEKSLTEVKTLSGLLPICAHCKKVRDDQGYWKQIEEYISERSDADFSHGICPECARKLYPQLRLDKLK